MSEQITIPRSSVVLLVALSIGLVALVSPVSAQTQGDIVEKSEYEVSPDDIVYISMSPENATNVQEAEVRLESNTPGWTIRSVQGESSFGNPVSGDTPYELGVDDTAFSGLIETDQDWIVGIVPPSDAAGGENYTFVANQFSSAGKQFATDQFVVSISQQSPQFEIVKPSSGKTYSATTNSDIEIDLEVRNTGSVVGSAIANLNVSDKQNDKKNIKNVQPNTTSTVSLVGTTPSEEGEYNWNISLNEAEPVTGSVNVTSPKEDQQTSESDYSVTPGGDVSVQFNLQQRSEVQTSGETGAWTLKSTEGQGTFASPGVGDLPKELSKDTNILSGRVSPDDGYSITLESPENATPNDTYDFTSNIVSDGSTVRTKTFTIKITDQKPRPPGLPEEATTAQYYAVTSGGELNLTTILDANSERASKPIGEIKDQSGNYIQLPIEDLLAINELRASQAGNSGQG